MNRTCVPAFVCYDCLHKTGRTEPHVRFVTVWYSRVAWGKAHAHLADNPAWIAQNVKP